MFTKFVEHAVLDRPSAEGVRILVGEPSQFLMCFLVMYYVYVLKNPFGRLYVGSTQNLEERVKRHQGGGVRWTSAHGPWELAYSETFSTRAEAMRRERSLKSGKQNQTLREHVIGGKPF